MPHEPVGFDVRQATPHDLGNVVGLLHQAYAWLIAQGITDQWARPFPPESNASLIERGEVYVASHHGRVIATFTLTYTPDAELWGNPPDDAGYIRRVAVDRAYGGQGIGAQILHHAGQIAAASGRSWLRLDCAKHNRRLHNYYRRQGFRQSSNSRTGTPRIRRAVRATRRSMRDTRAPDPGD